MKRSAQQQNCVPIAASSAQSSAHLESRAAVCSRVDLPSDTAVKLRASEETKTDAAGLLAVDLAPVDHMHSEFKQRRKIALTGLPPTSPHEVLDELRKEHSFSLASEIKDGSVRLLFPDTTQAADCIRKLKVSKFKGHKLAATFGHPDSLLFVGNLPFDFQNTELRQLFEGFGDVLRCFMVHSPRTGRNKGYAFVEYVTRSQALLAKQNVAAKTVGHRGLRVDFADNGMQTLEDLQSSTLFVDKLNKNFVEDKLLRAVFSKHGTVNFCQVATDSSGSSRGFAFVDMSSSEEADQAQAECNGMMFAGQDLRVAFSMPCRPGACILQHKTSVPTQCVSVPMATKHDPPEVKTTPSVAASLAVLAAPTVLSDNTNRSAVVLCGDEGWKHSTESVHIASTKTLACTEITDCCRKRPLDNEEWEEQRGVYDQPYIGQHQQGIPFLHPLKRIRIGVMSSKGITN